MIMLQCSAQARAVRHRQSCAGNSGEPYKAHRPDQRPRGAALAAAKSGLIKIGENHKPKADDAGLTMRPADLARQIGIRRREKPQRTGARALADLPPGA